MGIHWADGDMSAAQRPRLSRSGPLLQQRAKSWATCESDSGSGKLGISSFGYRSTTWGSLAQRALLHVVWRWHCGVYARALVPSNLLPINCMNCFVRVSGGDARICCCHTRNGIDHQKIVKQPTTVRHLGHDAWHTTFFLAWQWLAAWHNCRPSSRVSSPSD